MLNRCWFLTLMPVLATTLLAAPAQSPPGLIATFAGKNSPPDLRVLRLPALYVPANTPPSTFAPAGPFTATISGNLELRLRDELSFSLAGRGTIKLTINGQKLLELSGDNWRHEPTQTLTLNKGKNPILIEYTSPESGDAFFRLYWSSSDFPPEPIPPTIFTHETTAQLSTADELREGRFLFANLRCFKCHTDPALEPPMQTLTIEWGAAGGRSFGNRNSTRVPRLREPKRSTLRTGRRPLTNLKAKSNPLPWWRS